jgi:hypothetical protein
MSWDSKAGLVEELSCKPLRERGGHVKKKGFQESTEACDAKEAGVRMSDMYRDRIMQQ